MYTSAIYGVLDSAQRRFTFCNAGHLPVLVVRSGRAEFVPSSGSLLGLGRTSPEEVTVHLAEGDRIILVTDGLVERRDEVIDVGLERLRLAALRFHDRSLPEMIDELVATVAPEAPASDDIAIVAFSV
jgi:serine phosphatase RsbU (regulator of sigma subunit)